MAKESLEEIGEEIRFSYPDAMVENRGKSLFISIPDSDAENLDYYYLYACEDGRYLLGNFMAMYDDGVDYKVRFIVPMHLLLYPNDRPLSDIGYGYGKSFEMVAGATIEDVYNFYQTCRYYEVERSEDEVKLISTYRENKMENDQVTIDYQMVRPSNIKVTTQNGRNYFTCTIEEGE